MRHPQIFFARRPRPASATSLHATRSPLPCPSALRAADINEGEADCIEVRVGDDPAALAARFVEKHALPQCITDALAAHLADNLDAALRNAAEAAAAAAAAEVRARCAWGLAAPPPARAAAACFVRPARKRERALAEVRRARPQPMDGASPLTDEAPRIDGSLHFVEVEPDW